MTPSTDEHHWFRLEREPTGPRLSRAVCTCSWRSEWTDWAARAVGDRLVHTRANMTDSQTPKVVQAFRAIDAIQEDINRIEAAGLRLIDPTTDPLHIAARRILAAYQVFQDDDNRDALRVTLADLEAASDPVTAADLDALRGEPEE